MLPHSIESPFSPTEKQVDTVDRILGTFASKQINAKSADNRALGGTKGPKRPNKPISPSMRLHQSTVDRQASKSCWLFSSAANGVFKTSNQGGVEGSIHPDTSSVYLRDREQIRIIYFSLIGSFQSMWNPTRIDGRLPNPSEIEYLQPHASTTYNSVLLKPRERKGHRTTSGTVPGAKFYWKEDNQIQTTKYWGCEWAIRWYGPSGIQEHTQRVSLFAWGWPFHDVFNPLQTLPKLSSANQTRNVLIERRDRNCRWHH